MKKIFLIDCPGTVPPNNKDSEADVVLKGGPLFMVLFWCFWSSTFYVFFFFFFFFSYPLPLCDNHRNCRMNTRLISARPVLPTSYSVISHTRLHTSYRSRTYRAIGGCYSVHQRSPWWDPHVLFSSCQLLRSLGSLPQQTALSPSICAVCTASRTSRTTSTSLNNMPGTQENCSRWGVLEPTTIQYFNWLIGRGKVEGTVLDFVSWMAHFVTLFVLLILLSLILCLSASLYEVSCLVDDDSPLLFLTHQGGEPDLNSAAKMVLQDWQRGKIPYFTLPPGRSSLPGFTAQLEGSGSV